MQTALMLLDDNWLLDIACRNSPIYRAVFVFDNNIPVIFQVASLLAALTHPGHIVIYAPGDSLPCRRDAS
ncbi:hypothetical protein Ppb6_02580 [Photorhabdus australis subsp. thailandensis]|uniref:Uncharacterized protein n=1 Tax=Photorhabdus australis subsp. thailandensis TaxID=2805096 RepID=A0A1C0U2X4_9GAMM|nr:hypothetical protein Ppb6_02580 [Photorhabdus australis subsp. thailandensis]